MRQDDCRRGERILEEMRRSFLVLTCLAGLLVTGCDSGNPVAPPAPDPGGPGTSELTVSVTTDRARVDMGSTQPVVLTVTVRNKDGSPAADGTEVRVNTSLGSFGSDTSGQPVQLVTLRLTGGSATVELFAGDQIGTAVVLAQVGTSTGRLNVSIVEPSPEPVADFTFQVSDLSVLFEDASTGEPTDFAWNFGDGTTDNTQNPPPHEYAAEGTYTVSLTVSNSSGESTKRQFVTVEAGLLDADFAFDVNGLTVLFTDTTSGEPTDWFWEFGDNSTSTAQSPAHTYARAGSYAVSLTVSDEFGSTSTASRFVTVSLGEAPQADFQFQADGLRVLFTDASTGNPTSWSWVFGDGSGSTARNPEHAYAQAGTYNVTLTATNAAGSSSKSKFVTVSLGAPPTANFDFQANGLRVVFTDRSTGNPKTWSWDFGDGTTSNVQNPPTHTYAAAGNYTVILNVTNDAGADQVSKVITVGASSPPVADFCYQRQGLVVIFTDISTQTPTSWSWNFGDCESQPTTCMSTVQNPGHTFLAAGTYAVSLRVTNAAGQNTRSKFVAVDTTTTDSFPICF
jgi:PKD repeat protein